MAAKAKDGERADGEAGERSGAGGGSSAAPSSSAVSSSAVSSSAFGGLTEGRIVHYVLGPVGPGNGRAGEHRAAMVVKVWPDSGEAGTVQLQVFLDGTNDDPRDGAGLAWYSNVPFSADGAPGTWHWVERA